MAGYTNAKVIRIIPDQPGRGGSKSSLSTHSLNLDIRTAYNVFVTYGRWRRAQQAIPASGYQTVPGIVQSFALHNYAAFDTSNANLPPVNKLLSHSLANTGDHHIYQHNSIVSVKSYNPVGADKAIPASFLNIKNRCFMCWAATNNFIYDSIAVRTYDVGIDAPATAATYEFGGINSYFVFATAGGVRVALLNPGADTLPTDITAVSIGGVTYETLQPTPTDSGPFTTGGDATGTSGNYTLTINGYLFPMFDYDGMRLTVDGNEYIIISYTLGATDTTVTLFTPLITSPSNSSYTITGKQIILATPYVGNTTTNVVDTGFTVFTSDTVAKAYNGPLSWEGTPPQYAYAYYDDPATNTANGFGTGHISNISPITYVTEQNQSGVSVILHDIIDSGADDQPRFNKIQIFRTIIIGGGAVLYPLDPSVGLINNDGSGPHDFTDIYDDSFLNTTGGFSAPLVTNRKPPASAHQGYWDGRVWINPVNDPSLIMYSGSVDDILYGVPEECYPSAYAIRIPSDDGRVTGMRLVGPFLVITTERYAYYPVGGPTARTYQLRRFSTMMYGVGDYQMTEFVGQTTDDADSMMYIGKDKKVYLTAPQLGNIPMSDPVQDVFNAGITTGYPDVRIADIAINGNHYIVNTLATKTEAYDWDRKVWTDQVVEVANLGAVRPQAFAKVYGTSVPVQFLFVHNGAIYDWLGTNGTTGASGAYVATNPLMLGEKSRWLLNEVRLYVSDNSNPWGVATSVNEGGGYQWEAIPQPDPLNALQTTFPLDSPNAVELIMVPFVQAQPVQAGYRFQVIVNWPSDTVIRDLYAIDIILTKIGEDGQADV